MARPRFVALLLALITLLAFLPVARDGFLNYDDDVYVTQNLVVQNGLTFAGIKWTFTTFHASNWHPLTWLSLMLDNQLFGLNAGAFHFVNALFHAANTVLLFLLLLRLTRARSETKTKISSQTNSLWPCAFIAALFAWHPLHVESVAWISERKDVLSAFFALLTLLSYARHAQNPSKIENQKPKIGSTNSTRDYFSALIFFALCLMAKPMFVTLPFVMLLLDFWPLQRISNFKLQTSNVVPLIVEKIPFFLLTIISCVVTYFAQSRPSEDAVVSLEQVPLHYRILNALISYARYLLKLFWPAHLAVIYPLLENLRRMIELGICAALALAVITCFFWRTRRRFPYLPVGWLWFLGTLVPVIGLVQVGGAALADRYIYFPSIGIFIIVAFGARDLARRFQFPKFILPAAAVLVCGACLILTEHQLRYWRDSETLFRHALAVTKNNEIAHLNLGAALELEGKKNEALVEYHAAEKIEPRRSQVHINIGSLLDDFGKPEAALAEYNQASQINPNIPKLRDGIGIVLTELGRYDEAMSEFTNAAKLDPTYPWPYFQMAKTLLKQGRDAKAVEKLRHALRIEPDNFQILAYTAHVLSADENPKIRDGKTAVTLAVKANVITDGRQPFVLDALGMAFAETGDFTNAQQAAQRALDLATAAKMKKIEPLKDRLELYKSHQPWRESFLATNAPPKKP